MATLTYSHFGNPSRSHPCAHYTIHSTQESMTKAFSDLLMHENYGNALQLQSSRLHAAAGFLTLYI